MMLLLIYQKIEIEIFNLKPKKLTLLFNFKR